MLTQVICQKDEAPYIVMHSAQGSKNAVDAALNGIEIQAANGYLLDHFLNTSSNRSTDDYARSVEDPKVLPSEGIEAVGEVPVPQRVGGSLSPLSIFDEMGDEHPKTPFGCGAERLNRINLAYRHVAEPEIGRDRVSPEFKPHSVKGHADYPTLEQLRGEEPMTAIGTAEKN